jgi:hypothetical protein
MLSQALLKVLPEGIQVNQEPGTEDSWADPHLI